MEIDVPKHVRHWLDGAEENLEVAEVLCREGHYEWSLFIGHLVLEKDLKAICVKVTKEIPPRVHNLLLLARSGGVSLDKEREEFLSRVNDFQTQVRYPVFQERPRRRYTRPFGEEMLAKIKECHVWLRSLATL